MLCKRENYYRILRLTKNVTSSGSTTNVKILLLFNISVTLFDCVRLSKYHQLNNQIMKKAIFVLGMALVSITFSANATPVLSSQHQIGVLFSSSTPLCAAISKGDVLAVKKFIEYGADVNEKSNDMTPLMIAARYNNIEIVKLLLDNGADSSIKNKNGFTALTFAKMSKAIDTENYLTSLAKN